MLMHAEEMGNGLETWQKKAWTSRTWPKNSLKPHNIDLCNGKSNIAQNDKQRQWGHFWCSGGGVLVDRRNTHTHTLDWIESGYGLPSDSFVGYKADSGKLYASEKCSAVISSHNQLSFSIYVCLARNALYICSHLVGAPFATVCIQCTATKRCIMSIFCVWYYFNDISLRLLVWLMGANVELVPIFGYSTVRPRPEIANVEISSKIAYMQQLFHHSHNTLP